MKEIYKTEKFDPEHTHFGGLIYQSDFNTNYRGKDNKNGSTIAQRIESDMKHDQKLYETHQKVKRKNRNTYGQPRKYD